MRTPPAALLVVLCALLGACSSAREAADTTGPAPRTPGAEALPEIAPVQGPLAVTVAYPPPGAVRPNADSTFIFGSVGTGGAALRINGAPVPTAPNGAFLAYLPVPEDGTWRLVATADGATAEATRSYAPRASGVAAFASPRAGVVRTGRDTLATGSEIASAAPTPGGDRRWFFPRGARLTLTGRLGGDYRVRLGDREAWVDTASVRIEDAAPAPAPAVGTVTFEAAERWMDVRLPVGAAPFLLAAEGRTVEVTLYDVRPPASSVRAPGGFVASAAAEAVPGGVRLSIMLDRPLWGYKAFYEADGTLVLRLRRPPVVDAARPLAGVRVLIDAGHPPGGAIGPTGLTEPEANLAIVRRMVPLLRARGATVLLTRDDADPIVSATSAAEELWARVDLAVDVDADVLVSVHNNAFPDGVDPFGNVGTEVYYYHAFSLPLARALQRSIVAVTGLPDLGAKQRSLALVRPSWMPSALTESLFMMFPRQEAALRDPAFLDALAEAHVRGLEAFLRQVARE